MPISIYVGISGSGKSYEVVANLIVPAIRSGRRVVTNIAGINYDEIVKYCISQGDDPTKLAQLVSCTHEDIISPYFFKHEDDDKNGIETFVKNGDLVAIDEIWRSIPKNKPLTDRQLNFCKMHRHMVDDKTGLVIEFACISQLIKDLHDDIKGNSIQTYWMQKATKVGLENRYEVAVYGEGGKTTKSNLIAQYPLQSYNPVFFPMYKSHSLKKDGVIVDERQLSKRGSIFSSNFFRYGLPLSLVLGCGAGWWLVSFISNGAFFAKKETEKPAKIVHQKDSKSSVQTPLTENSLRPNPDTTHANVTQSKPVNVFQNPVLWSVTGFYKVENDIFFYVSNGSNILILKNPVHTFVGRNVMLTMPDGSLANNYSNVQNEKNSLSF